MQQGRFAGTMQPVWQMVLIGFAILAYVLNLVGVVWTSAVGDALSSIALLGLGAAVSRLTLAHLPQTTTRLSARVQALWRRERRLALLCAVAVYLALIFGALVTNMGGLWYCDTLPLCAPSEAHAGFALAHRGLAAAATLLVMAAAVWAMRTYEERAIRRAAIWAIALIVAQNVVGLLLVLAAQGGEGEALDYARLAHLAVGACTWSAVIVAVTLILRVPPVGPADWRTPPAVAEAKQPSRWMDYVSLTKPRVITLLIFTTIATMFITPAGVPSLSLVLWTLLGGWLMPAGAQALNCYFDRDIDAKMGRTGRRPLPSGRLPAWHALVLGLALGVLAFAILALFVNLLTALVALVGYIYYAYIYTIVLKRHSVHNIVIGGGAGAIPPLVGWTAVTGTLTWPSLLLFAVIFFWTPPHFWALALLRRRDYANAGIPMLPVVAGDAETKRQIALHTAVMFVLSLLLTPFNLMGTAYLVMALLLGLLFVGYVVRLIRKDTPAARWALYRFSLLYLFLLFVAMMVDRLVFV